MSSAVSEVPSSNNCETSPSKSIAALVKILRLVAMASISASSSLEVRFGIAVAETAQMKRMMFFMATILSFEMSG